jgi:rSAM/selenodomain-associated transferase 1
MQQKKPDRPSERGARHSPVAVSSKAEAAVIFFAKAPIPGEVKTRLCPPLTPDEAASLHGSFVLDALEGSRALSRVDRYVACSPSSDHVFFKILEDRYQVGLMDQIGADLGARMHHACAAAFERGYRKVLLVGTDLPTLDPALYRQGLQLLATHEVVFGPSLDGGYYLIGLTKLIPDLFVGIPWSTDQVLAVSRGKADSLGLRTEALPSCRDVDTIEDVRALIEEADASAMANRSGVSKRTAGALRLIADRLRQREGT